MVTKPSAIAGQAVNVLGIVVPTIEVVTSRAWNSHHAPSSTSFQQVVGVFATQATARSQVYEVEIAKRRPNISVVTEPCPGLAALIEQGAGAQEVGAVIDHHVAAMLRRIGRPPDRVILDSTHHQVVAELFRRALPDTTELVQQPRATAAAARIGRGLLERVAFIRKRVGAALCGVRPEIGGSAQAKS